MFILDTVPGILAWGVDANQSVSQAAPGLADGNDGQRQQNKRRKPLGSGDVGAVALKQQEPPGSDTLMASAGLLAVIVAVIKPVDRRAQEPDPLAFPLCEVIEGCRVVG